MNADVIEVQLFAPTIVRVDVKPGGQGDERTWSLDPGLSVKDVPDLRTGEDPAVLETKQIRVEIAAGIVPSITIRDASGNAVTEPDPISDAEAHALRLQRATEESLYGMRGVSLEDPHPVFTRDQGAVIVAGVQGDGGAPFFFTRHYGVFIDSNGGAFSTSGKAVTFSKNSRSELEYFVLVGSPLSVMAGVADLSGHPPLPPKWSLGFLNSQWKCTESELRGIVDTYRSKHIPLDGFILDFDWKAWGEDNYGEWRWNSTSTPGNFDPNKFPNGASGVLANDLLKEGVHLSGILKPRILIYKKDSTTTLQKAAAYAEEHHLWYPKEPAYEDYFTHRPARDLDFRMPATRSWIWQHLQPAFDAGMQGWWNDEADDTELLDKSDFVFDNYQFFSMGQMLYEGQRSHSNLRVWSLNRNFYPGAQRFGYAEWSGDIDTGFESMQNQSVRMLATLNLGEPHWSMDAGGFGGHPTPEVYARWMEFAAFVPIFRVHGDKFEKRQPWVYGPTAEAAATRAIRLRYELMPYIYSAERHTYETGVGIVRPLLWVFPSDLNAAAQVNEWMFGDSLLVAPVLQPNTEERSVYLPNGKWYEYFSGEAFAGRRRVTLKIDSKSWGDIPLFVRDGSILATQPPQDYTNQSPAAEITLDIFPGDEGNKFVYYDDDGATYFYENGAFYRQEIQAVRSGQIDSVQLSTPAGSFHPALRTYLMRVHGRAAHLVSLNAKPLKHDLSARSFAEGKAISWAASHDRFGPVTLIRVNAQVASELMLQD